MVHKNFGHGSDCGQQIAGEGTPMHALNLKSKFFLNILWSGFLFSQYFKKVFFLSRPLVKQLGHPVQKGQ